MSEQPRFAQSPAAQLRQRYFALEERLSAPQASQERDALKGDIAALLRMLEQEITDLSALRDQSRKLVDRWKLLPETASLSNAPEFSTERPVVHADHLGASTFVEKGWSRITLGDYDGAEAALRKALQLSPNDPQAESLLGWAMMLGEKYDDALMAFQKVLMQEPANALARVNVGYICLKKRIFGEAIEHLSRAIRLDNDRKATLYANFYLGLVYLERDMFEDAQTFFQKTIELGPNLIEAYYELGRAFWFNGEHDEALATWQKGLAAN
ncbi:MAG TPA: tetratricopeptide repeat protein, partial [Gemmatimonadaceae bacterium]|nr:tetratricopeptide repeat protein [Gemmatimonadaceae bacterium]